VAEDIRVALGAERLTHTRWKWLARLADEAYGLPRHIGQHPGGMVISTQPLLDCVPIVPAAMAGRQMVQWDKDSCADGGFLKIDILGLGMLSAVERCVELIARRTGEQVDLSRIPFDDAATFKAIQEADTTGVFQIESRAQMGSLRRVRPATLADLTIQVALVRPGPIVGGAVNTYIRRRQEMLRNPNYQVPFLHSSLRECLAETLGTIVFQDQVLEVSQAFAGFTAGQAESLRRAMSRKRSVQAIEAHHLQFVLGAIKLHPDVQIELAEQVWAMVAGFAGFGFPKSHGAAFGLLAYQSTWLRVHHPAEFLCALLSEQPMGFYPPDALIHEAQHHEVIILPPDVLHSESECTLNQAGEIRIGLNYVKGIHKDDIEALVASRDSGGPFDNLADFAARAGVSTRTLERLAWSGACDQLAGDGPHARRTALWQLGVAQPAVKTKGGQQLALPLALPDAPALDPLSEWQSMIADYTATGISIDRHPLRLLREQLSSEGALSIGELAGVRHQTPVKVGGFVIARQKPQTANGITFLLIEDEHGTLNVIVPQKLYEKYRTIVRTEPLIRIAGILERHADGGGAINLLATSIDRLSLRSDSTTAAVTQLHQAEAAHAVADDFAVSAPAVTNFGRGRGR